MQSVQITREQAAEALDRYLEEIRRTPALDDPRVKRVAKRLLPSAVRPTVALLVTDAVRPFSRRTARRLAVRRGPLLVHLGSGRTPKAGWVNVDTLGKAADLSWNLRRPLPFGADSVDGVFHEHVLEHFTLPQAYELMKEAFRVLRPGGVLRAAVPDAGRYVRGYRAGDEDLENLRPGRPTQMLAVQEVFNQHGHRSAYDLETLCLLLTAAGFAGARGREFGDTDLPESPDSEHRRSESLYVEARKPEWDLDRRDPARAASGMPGQR